MLLKSTVFSLFKKMHCRELNLWIFPLWLKLSFSLFLMIFIFSSLTSSSLIIFFYSTSSFHILCLIISAMFSPVGYDSFLSKIREFLGSFPFSLVLLSSILDNFCYLMSVSLLAASEIFLKNVRQWVNLFNHQFT